MLFGQTTFFNWRYAISLACLLVLRHVHKLVTIPLNSVSSKGRGDFGNFDAKLRDENILGIKNKQTKSAVRVMKFEICKINKIRQRDR